MAPNGAYRSRGRAHRHPGRRRLTFTTRQDRRFLADRARVQPARHRRTCHSAARFKFHAHGVVDGRRSRPRPAAGRPRRAHRHYAAGEDPDSGGTLRRARFGHPEAVRSGRVSPALETAVPGDRPGSRIPCYLVIVLGRGIIGGVGIVAGAALAEQARPSGPPPRA